MGRHSRAALAAVVAASSLTMLGATASTTASAAAQPSSARQQAYERAAAEYGVPSAVLLGVSYLESRWDTNAGTPSTTGGYGPMHLTDAAPLLAGGTHHDEGTEDARGDESRPLQLESRAPAPLPESLRTAPEAQDLTGIDAAALKSDPTQNIRGGAALLAEYQRQLGAPRSADPADWYGAVARYGGSTDATAARSFAEQVYAQIRRGADRVTDDGQHVTLTPTSVTPDTAWVDRLGLPPGTRDAGSVECPTGLDCEWIPAPYQQTGSTPGAYGNHDLSQRPANQRIRFVVIHDTEATYATTLGLVQDPTYVSWQYTLRSSDGHIAQHVNSNDVAWQAGNWYVNATSIGLEHEGFAAQGTWYTEALYRSSAALVGYLAQRFGIPLDRQHIVGHDNVPGTVPSTVRGMHWDPGPYWDWQHYFDLMGAPFQATAPARAELVTIKPDYATNRPAFYGCDSANPSALCPSRGSSSVILHSAPSDSAPLVVDVGLHPDGSPSTMLISDHGARAATGQQYAVADVQGDWTAIWYLGQKAWFHSADAVPASGLVATPRPGKATIPVYGRAYPEATAYPSTIPYQTITPLQYTLHAGERYAVGQTAPGEYYRAVTFNCLGAGDCTVVRGQMQYVQIQFGHRTMFVNAADVIVRSTFTATPLPPG
jgi:N-acetyl-anhydromuramyl-L-alanine amidase AmpD